MTKCENCRKYKKCHREGGYLDTIMEEGLYPNGECYKESLIHRLMLIFKKIRNKQ